MSSTTTDNGVLAVLANPVLGTRLETIARVLAVVGLDTTKAEEYEIALYARYSYVKKSLNWYAAFTMFGTMNSWALEDVFGLDAARDDKTITMTCNFLWRALTGQDPALEPDLQVVASDRLRALGVR
jgi:hypothetical protein